MNEKKVKKIINKHVLKSLGFYYAGDGEEIKEKIKNLIKDIISQACKEDIISHESGGIIFRDESIVTQPGIIYKFIQDEIVKLKKDMESELKKELDFIKMRLCKIEKKIK